MRRVTRFEVVAPADIESKPVARLHLGADGSDGDLQLEAAGSYLIVFETDNKAENHLPAARFNEYLEAEGLAPALDLRARSNQMGKDGNELYGRRAKAIVMTGTPLIGRDRHVTRAVGLSLEIVPERSPHEVPKPGTFPLKVLFEGAPLAGALVKLTDLGHDDVPLATQRTDSTGRAVFDMPPAGQWLFNVIWTKSLDGSAGADYETTFSSLTFAVE